jgi:protein gp37
VTGKSAIEWTEATWNPIVGCSILSPGCTNCYAMKMGARIQKMNRTGGTNSNYVNHYDGTTKSVKGNVVWTGKLARAPRKLFQMPLSRKKPTTFFVNSMGDLFHEDVPDEWIDEVFAVMALAPQHTFQVLTKRADRMQYYMKLLYPRSHAVAKAAVHLGVWDDADSIYDNVERLLHAPLPNVWLGVSTERQQEWDDRTEHLRQTPAAVRFVSAEPLLGPIEMRLAATSYGFPQHIDRRGNAHGLPHWLHWVIVGGESGPGSRPMHPAWARSLRDQCLAAGVPLFFKQWGEWVPQLGAIDLYEFGEVSRRRWVAWDGEQWDYWDRPAWCDDIGAPEDCLVKVGKKAAGGMLDGKLHNEFPARAENLHGV